MEAFEAVRQAASKLHEQAVAAGADPWSPGELVAVAADLLECNIQDVAKNDPSLRGGRALYDPEMRLILRDAGAPDIEKALLAGHELGHAAVHDTNEVVVTVEIDPSRAIDSGETAAERLEAYGPRERREIQMDLFAREFLLPRARARALHLGEELGAAAIASRSALPYPLVAQQLLDASFCRRSRRRPPSSGSRPSTQARREPPRTAEARSSFRPGRAPARLERSLRVSSSSSTPAPIPRRSLS